MIYRQIGHQQGFPVAWANKFPFLLKTVWVWFLMSLILLFLSKLIMMFCSCSLEAKALTPESSFPYFYLFPWIIFHDWEIHKSVCHPYWENMEVSVILTYKWTQLTCSFVLCRKWHYVDFPQFGLLGHMYNSMNKNVVHSGQWTDEEDWVLSLGLTLSDLVQVV